MASKIATWEYKYESITSGAALAQGCSRLDFINGFGADGWEVVSFTIDHNIWYVFMKRRTN